MEKIINISGKNVGFKASAGTLYRYRFSFQRDLIKDILKLKNVLNKKAKSPEEQLEVMDLEIFEQVAWAMAKTYDSSIPPIENWLDEFDMFSIYQVLPQISDLMVSMFGGEPEKKNIVPPEVQHN